MGEKQNLADVFGALHQYMGVTNIPQSECCEGDGLDEATFIEGPYNLTQVCEDIGLVFARSSSKARRRE
jgi:hypothetical protein